MALADVPFPRPLSPVRVVVPGTTAVLLRVDGVDLSGLDHASEARIKTDLSTVFHRLVLLEDIVTVLGCLGIPSVLHDASKLLSRKKHGKPPLTGASSARRRF